MNRNLEKTFIAFVLLSTVGALQAAEPWVVTVDPARGVVVVPEIPRDPDTLRGNPRIAWESALELQKHLTLVTGTEPPIALEAPEGHYAFRVGIAPAGTDIDLLADQQTCWTITPEGAYLYGANAWDTQYAVYGFLQDQLEIAWIAPGDQGIVYRERAPLTLRVGDFAWTPTLWSRSIRPDTTMLRPGHSKFHMTRDEIQAYRQDALQWYRRMRMGGNSPIATHAFSGWWQRFGKTRPDYFALNKYGRREPVPLSRPERSESWIKICASNPAVAEQLVADWLPRKDGRPFISVGVNDGTQNFCECPECRALDVTLEGEAWDRHLTDRYTVLANRVARLAREHREDAFALMYAYMTTLDPPRRERLEPNVIVTLVPYVDPLDSDQVREHYQGWRRMGATKFTFRPNYHHKYLTWCMPVGVEKEFFDVFQAAYREGCIATNYDCMLHNWVKDGIVDFILARSMGEPDQPFDHWAAQYYNAFGAAADDVQAYFEYWRRELWEGRLRPDLTRIARRGGAGDFVRGLAWSLGEYYTEADFAETHRILETAATRDLTEVERTRLQQLQLFNEHARRTFQVIVAPPYEKPAMAAALMAYRRDIRDALPMPWQRILSNERYWGDLLGLEIGEEMAEFRTPWLQTDLYWKFMLDRDFSVDPTLDRPAIYAYEPESQPEWFRRTWDEVADWYDFRTDRFWGRQVEDDEFLDVSPETAAVINDYIGVGWYATRIAIPDDWKGREIHLRLGAVDESGWVYVNGQYAGKRIFDRGGDWMEPFNLRIDPFIDWERDEQVIMVRVQNTAGMGGLWKRSWVVSK